MPWRKIIERQKGIRDGLYSFESIIEAISFLLNEPCKTAMTPSTLHT